MSYEVKLLSGDEANKSGYPGFNEDRNILEIYMDGELMENYTDYGKCEDNSFFRDWDWVRVELIKAYQKGVRDGKKTRNEVDVKAI